MVELTQEELRQLQLVELEMLDEVDRICKKNNIHYSLDGGTLIGAVRHKGFIPWDDDLDIMLLHDEYEKFYHACQTDLDTSRFFFQDYRTDPDYRWGYGKIRRLGSEYVKSGQQQLKQRTGICIDVFDFESVPDDFPKRKRFMFQMFCIRKTLYSMLGRTNEESFALRQLYWLLSCIPNAFVHKLKNKLTNRYNAQNTSNVMCLMWPEKNCPYGYPREVFSDYVELEFEGKRYMAIQGYDLYLKYQYGDYMTLPPVEERKGVMDAVVLRFPDKE